ncbi:MAG TPA: hypothetical protein VHZ78_11645 [Rhizomicrobium sp.]|jgi:hypothetical protein|nr:hypothetical protein [Rhizomicrobium sp.]
MNAHVPAPAEIQDGDRDALHILPLATLPIAHPVLRRAKLVKNARLDAAIEIFNAPGCGSGQFDVPEISKLLGLQKTPPDPDVDLLQRVAVLPSYDVYSLRILLRACAIPIAADNSVLSLSSAKIESLSAYMATFTRPLVEEIFGAETNVAHFTDILGMFRDCSAQTVLARLATMAQKLGIPVPGIPKFLEDYADIFMSLSYYKQCLDQLLPQVQAFMISLADIRSNHQLRNDTNLMKTVDFTEATINGTLANITGRLESFDKSTADMWRNLSAERFRKIEQLILGYHTVIGGVLCALSVKMNAWTRQFPAPGAAGPVRRAAFIMSDMRQGIDRISAIEDTRPVLSELND